ncbi:MULTISPECIES: hypothetical protein [Paraburkholderia]|uniref:hypothetical protein n=1 Tax=Paraburkholderia TaxID=1822464 RepID=UPI0015C55DE0|nr:hypothetical protein [Paraburkholderia madseniana]NPT69186.1 hypothetical protein [Paraburkholderia madseniana]
MLAHDWTISALRQCQIPTGFNSWPVSTPALRNTADYGIDLVRYFGDNGMGSVEFRPHGDTDS